MQPWPQDFRFLSALPGLGNWGTNVTVWARFLLGSRTHSRTPKPCRPRHLTPTDSMICIESILQMERVKMWCVERTWGPTPLRKRQRLGFCAICMEDLKGVN